MGVLAKNMEKTHWCLGEVGFKLGVAAEEVDGEGPAPSGRSVGARPVYRR